MPDSLCKWVGNYHYAWRPADRVEYCCVGGPNGDQYYDNVKQIKGYKTGKNMKEIYNFIQKVSRLVAVYKAQDDEDTETDL